MLTRPSLVITVPATVGAGVGDLYIIVTDSNWFAGSCSEAGGRQNACLLDR